MRIIAGQFRGRRLLPPANDATRPITDRVKQSLFDIVTPLLAGARVYDCFAGTGSMGLECLSREAASVVFFEADRSAAALLRRNIETLGVGRECRIITGDLFGWLAAPANAPPANEQADLIFFDPPYRFLSERPVQLQKTVAVMAACFLKPGGTLVFRHDAGDALALPPLIARDIRTYGSMTVELLDGPGGERGS